MLLGDVLGEHLGVGVVLEKGAGVDLLARQEPGSAFARHQTEGGVGDARHGGQAEIEAGGTGHAFIVPVYALH
jgi:hypothetical protein